MYTNNQTETKFSSSQYNKDTSTMAADNVPLPELEKLAEQVGEFIHYWGFKRIHGKIWTHMFLAKKPLDAADLVREMKISKALVSISLRELLDFEVVIEAGKSERGTNLYRTNPDILAVILKVLREREKKMLLEVRNAFEQLAAAPQEKREATGVSQKRLAQLASLITNAETSLDSLIALKSVDFGQWREAFLTEAEADQPGPVPRIS